jgi:hypothetical protein
MASGLAHVVLVPTKARSGVLERSFHVDKTDEGVPITFPAHAAFAGDGRHALVGTAAGCLLVWDRSSGKLMAGLEHPDGKCLLAPVDPSFLTFLRSWPSADCGEPARLDGQARLPGYWYKRQAHMVAAARVDRYVACFLHTTWS